MSEPGYLFSSSGVSFGLTPPPADAGLHRAARRDLIKDRQLVRPLPENAAQSLCMLAPEPPPPKMIATAASGTSTPSLSTLDVTIALYCPPSNLRRMVFRSRAFV